MPSPTKTRQTSKTKAKNISKTAAKQVAGLQAGDKLPAFSMPGTKGDLSAASLKGKKTVLYFYPKDDTSGCTAEACDFQAKLPAFKRAGVQVIGISKDDLKSHDKFAKKYKLNFDLGFDEDAKIAKKFGVWVEKSLYGRKYMGMDRSTFLIDEKGKVQQAWRKVKVPGHVDDVLKAIKDGAK